LEGDKEEYEMVMSCGWYGVSLIIHKIMPKS